MTPDSQKNDTVHRPQPCVFVVEDDELCRTLFVRMLKVSGILVCAAASAHEAFELLNRGLAPDVALLDYRMPDYNGDVVFERIQQHQPGTPAIFCTAEYDPKLVQRLSALGAAACFGKPFDRVLLIEELNRLLAMRGPLHETRCALCEQRCSDNKVC